MLKQQFREQAKAYIPSYTKEEIRQKFFQQGRDLVVDYHIYGVFSAIRTEPDLSLLIETANRTDKIVLYPRIENENMVFAHVNKNNPLMSGAFSILEPQTPAFKEKIDLIFVPGLMFGLNGSRLGRGKGYYDRFLANIDTVKIGVCFEHNLRDELPEEPHDIRMDGVLTEKRLIWCCKK